MPDAERKEGKAMKRKKCGVELSILEECNFLSFLMRSINVNVQRVRVIFDSNGYLREREREREREGGEREKERNSK